MNIRYGYDIALELGQPATILAMADVHSDFRGQHHQESELEVAPAIAAERFVDDNGNIVRRLSAPAGRVSLRLQGVFRADGREDEVDSAAEAVAGVGPSGRYAAVPSGEPILRDRSSLRFRLGELRRRRRRLGAGAGDLRLRSSAPPI